MAVSAVKKEAGKPAAEAQEAAPAPKKKGLNWKLLVAALCAVGAGGGGAYWYLKGHSADAGNAQHSPQPAKLSQFLPLDPFTVNLVLEENPQFLQVGLTLKVTDTAGVEAIKLRMPEVRDSILLLLSGQKASGLLTVEGKRKLAAQIVASINAIVAPGAAPAPPKAAPVPVPVPVPAEAKTAEGEPEAEVKPEADAPPPAAAPAEAHASAPAPVPPVQGVLFISFIVQ
jgi:flagellar FliL protein